MCGCMGDGCMQHSLSITEAWADWILPCAPTALEQAAFNGATGRKPRCCGHVDG